MKISFIATVFNEEKTIKAFLQSIANQTMLPGEVILCDGGSTDDTLSEISNFKSQTLNKSIKIKLLEKQGNRSVGRNEAIRHATGEVILCSDAGCILDSNWVKNIVSPFIDSSLRGNDKVEVVAGYYEGKGRTVFEKCVIPYFLVMPDRVDPNNFLPATRSMAVKKSVWEALGGFDEQLSHNEDYAFAKKLKEKKYKIVFAKNAIIYWLPPNTIRQISVTFLRFAYGDAEARIFRPKVILVYIRYGVGLVMLIVALCFQSKLLWYLLGAIIIFYLAWAIGKNYRYIRKWQAVMYLPFLQLLSDFAVLLGTFLGIIRLRWDIPGMRSKE